MIHRIYSDEKHSSHRDNRGYSPHRESTRETYLSHCDNRDYLPRCDTAIAAHSSHRAFKRQKSSPHSDEYTSEDYSSHSDNTNQDYSPRKTYSSHLKSNIKSHSSHFDLRDCINKPFHQSVTNVSFI